jgi:hypothetical protein
MQVSLLGPADISGRFSMGLRDSVDRKVKRCEELNYPLVTAEEAVNAILCILGAPPCGKEEGTTES